MLFTALHALCDGVCMSQLAVEFNETMAKLHLGIPIPKQMPEHSPPLELLFINFPTFQNRYRQRQRHLRSFIPAKRVLRFMLSLNIQGLLKPLKRGAAIIS